METPKFINPFEEGSPEHTAFDSFASQAAQHEDKQTMMTEITLLTMQDWMDNLSARDSAILYVIVSSMDPMVFGGGKGAEKAALNAVCRIRGGIEVQLRTKHGLDGKNPLSAAREFIIEGQQ
ncbi:hypothetical protein SEA_CAMERICO_65 [Gordonia phage Camerico]|nr:hypothetical protein SEA_CAMERICO_65 [Gordonia phage Camerico]